MAELNPTRRSFVPFGYGFRPFFLLAGIYAIVSIGAWLWMHQQAASPFAPLLPQFWHGHEMVFGFMGAAIAGFLLTAVPNWTGSDGFSGAPLVGLTILWLAGRIAMAFIGSLPVVLVAIAELFFLPTLILMIAPLLLRAGNRNLPLLIVLAALWLADGLFIYAFGSNDPGLARTALLVALDLVLVLVTVIGGRIVPAFTRNALRQSGVDVSLSGNPVVERLVIVTMLAIVVGDLVAPDGFVAAVLAALAALIQARRLIGWQGWRMASKPIVWVLHVAYMWLPIGLAMKAVSLGAGSGWAGFWQHALGIGAAGTMILAVMTRAALGHTGRPLKVHSWITVAYLLLTASVVVRVFGAAALSLGYETVLTIAGALWIAAFVPYLVVYGPILLRPRIDGKPG